MTTTYNRKSKICANCNLEFTAKTINGHNVGYKRKFCFKCVPYGTNANNIYNQSVRGSVFICEVCKSEYVYKRGDYKDGHDGKVGGWGSTTTKCSKCVKKIRNIRVKIKAIKYKGGKCIKCGYNKCITSLSFHHRDPNTKEFRISKYKILSWNRLKIELDKCDLLCANCHMETHANYDSMLSYI